MKTARRDIIGAAALSGVPLPIGCGPSRVNAQARRCDDMEVTT